MVENNRHSTYLEDNSSFEQINLTRQFRANECAGSFLKASENFLLAIKKAEQAGIAMTEYWPIFYANTDIVWNSLTDGNGSSEIISAMENIYKAHARLQMELSTHNVLIDSSETPL